MMIQSKVQKLFSFLILIFSSSPILSFNLLSDNHRLQPLGNPDYCVIIPSLTNRPVLKIKKCSEISSRILTEWVVSDHFYYDQNNVKIQYQEIKLRSDRDKCLKIKAKSYKVANSTLVLYKDVPILDDCSSNENQDKKIIFLPETGQLMIVNNKNVTVNSNKCVVPNKNLSKLVIRNCHTPLFVDDYGIVRLDSSINLSLSDACIRKSTSNATNFNDDQAFLQIESPCNQGSDSNNYEPIEFSNNMMILDNLCVEAKAKPGKMNFLNLSPCEQAKTSLQAWSNFRFQLDAKNKIYTLLIDEENKSKKYCYEPVVVGKNLLKLAPCQMKIAQNQCYCRYGQVTRDQTVCSQEGIEACSKKCKKGYEYSAGVCKKRSGSRG